MRRALPISLLLATALALGGCGSNEEQTPVACLVGPQAYVAALEDSPAHMTLDGEVPIGDCLVENQEAGDIGQVGSSLVEAATVLNAEARAHPAGTKTFELGYLVGEVVAGSEDTQGIHDELVRRVESAARYSPQGEQLPAAFLATFQEGYDEGLIP